MHLRISIYNVTKGGEVRVVNNHGKAARSMWRSIIRADGRGRWTIRRKEGLVW